MVQTRGWIGGASDLRRSGSTATARADVEHAASFGDVLERPEERAGEKAAEDVRARRGGARGVGLVEHGQCS
jgi:hypothetical protein